MNKFDASDSASLWAAVEKKSENLSYKISSLSECAQEPLSFCGAIQSFGLMLIVDSANREILAYSKNWDSLLAANEGATLLGKPVSSLLGFEFNDGPLKAANMLKSLVLGKTLVPILGAPAAGYVLSNCYDQGDKIFFEFESPSTEVLEDSVGLIRDLVVGLRDDHCLATSCASIAEAARGFSGYDRVMVYRFDENWNGEVLAESKLEKLPSFLHLRYPATDIPEQARALFFKNQSRTIGDSSSLAVPLITQNLRPAEIDIGASLLRAVSPFHLQYLENMGVTATFSIPIRVANKLWGLIACHHNSGPKYPSHNMRSSFELAAQIFSGKVTELVERRRLLLKNDTLVFTHALLNQLASGTDMISSFGESADRLLSLTSSTSALVKIGDKKIFIGRPVSAETQKKIQDELRNETALTIWKCDNLFERLELSEPDANAAGALVVPFSLGFEDFLIWFRPEEALNIQWAGKPNVSDHEHGLRMHAMTPRSSFAEWSEGVRHRSQPWNESDEECAQYFLFGFVQEIFSRANALSVAYKELEHVAKSKDEFISTLSHELRSPLGVIIGWIDILRDYPQEFDEAKQAIEIIERNAKAQVSLIDDLLDVSRIISGKMRIEIQENISISNVISGVVESMRPAAQAKGIRILWNPANPIKMSADPDRLRQIVWNLCSNAMKFTPSDGEIEITVQSVASSVLIEVRDTGVGIDNNKLLVIFDRFVQANSAAVQAGGLGIGLSIVRGLTELHGGTITAYSAGRGKGSKLTITLPIQVYAPKLAAANGASQDSSSITRRGEHLKGLRILIAEDHADAQLALRIFCERNGALVQTANDGHQALEILKTSETDLILSDVGMPIIGGHELMRRWRLEEKSRNQNSIVAIALTAYATSKDRTLALEAGFSSHIAKPVDRAELLALILSLNVRRPV